MPLLRLRISKVGFSAIIGLIFFTCILNNIPAFSQAQLSNIVKIGVRLAVPPIANVQGTVGGEQKFGGFCYTFGKDLEAELRRTNPQTSVAFRVIKNEYRGSKNPRWGSLLTDYPDDRQDIQCGPNSKQDIPNNEIVFSNSNFLETGTKLFLKQDTLNKHFSSQSQKKLAELLDIVRSRIQVGAVQETTTFERLRGSGYNPHSFDTRSEALDALKVDSIQAFASDAIILRALLDEDSGNGRTYRDMGYAIFPTEDYLNGKTEQYAIAISNKDKNAQYSLQLLNATNQVLSQSKYGEERKKLEQYEREQVSSQGGTGQKSGSNTQGDSSGAQGNGSGGKNDKNDWWVQITVAIIAAAATLGGAYWQSRSGKNRKD